MNRYILAIGAIALAIRAGDLGAQRFTADLRGGLALPMQKLSGAELDAGPLLGATLAVRVQPYLHVYGGWDWAHFGADQSFAGAGVDVEETGYTLGLRFERPFGASSRADFRVEAGGTYKHIEIEDDDGDPIANSGHGVGYEAGASVLWAFMDSWRLVPAVRFRSLSRDFTIAGVKSSGDLRYVGLELGVSRRF